jgi:uncharacterized protein YdaU (DUF1376 family)
MQKDPRFNFYVDNWIGGCEGFTLEQIGAYLVLILFNFKVGRFTKLQGIDKLLQLTRGNAAASAELFNFLEYKFETDGTLYWSKRLELEIAKSENSSKKQSERARKRWHNRNGSAPKDTAASTAVMPFNRSGNRNSNSINTSVITTRVVESTSATLAEKLGQNLVNAFDEIYIEQNRIVWREKDFDAELNAFCIKVRGSPERYANHDSDGLRLALQAQLRNAPNKKKEPTRGKLQ